VHNSHLWEPQAGCGCVRRRPAFCQPQAKRAHRRGRARRVQPLLIVHFKNTRMRVDVLGPQSLHHRQHPMGRICVILFQLIFVEQLLQRLLLLRATCVAVTSRKLHTQFGRRAVTGLADWRRFETRPLEPWPHPP
jgi:hypothetical protein